MRILIIGGTGFIGREVCRALAGQELWVLHRGQTASYLPGLIHLKGYRQDLHAHRAAIGNIKPDVVLDMTPMSGADAQAVVDCLSGLAGRAVAISSGSVYRSFGILTRVEPGEVNNAPSREDSPLRTCLFPYRGPKPRARDDPRNWLDVYDKIPVEQTFLQQDRLPASVVRLPMVYGPGDPDSRLQPYLRRMLDRRAAIILHREGAAWRNSRGFVVNVAQAIARVVMQGIPGAVYNVAEPDDLTEADWIQALGRQVGWSGMVRTIPNDWDWRARPCIEELPVESNFAQHLRMDSSLIRRELGYCESVSVHDALRITVQRLMSAPLPVVDYFNDDLLLDAIEREQPPRQQAPN